MSTAIMEAQLRDALNADRELAGRGCLLRLLGPSGIVVEKRGTQVGIWHWRSGGFELVDSATGDELTKVDTVAEAVHVTRTRLCLGT